MQLPVGREWEGRQFHHPSPGQVAIDTDFGLFQNCSIFNVLDVTLILLLASLSKPFDILDVTLSSQVGPDRN